MFTTLPTRHRRRTLLALLWVAAAPVAVQAQGPHGPHGPNGRHGPQGPGRGHADAAAAITAITLELGGAGGSTVVLRRDGSATFTRTGHARHGTEDQVARGTVRRDDFAALARLALQLGVFEMDEAYQDPSIADGTWAIVTVERGAQSKKVFRREDAGPDALKQFEKAIESLQSRISFVPDRR